MKLLLERLPRCLVVHPKGRLMMVVLIVIATGLQWYCWSKRHPIVGQRQDEIRRITLLEDEVKKLERSWSDEEAANVESRLQQTNEHLLTGSPESGAWSEEIHQPGSVAAMAINATLGESKPHPRHPTALLLAPTTWHLDLKSSGGPGLTDVMDLLKSLTGEQAKRIDLVSLIISGDGNHLTNAEIGLDLWFLKEDDE
ncbi:MAG: hypothetical protein ACI9UA_000128 [Pseudoalteromonas tetraodonis]|jgi:hypothetical protein